MAAIKKTTFVHQNLYDQLRKYIWDTLWLATVITWWDSPIVALDIDHPQHQTWNYFYKGDKLADEGEKHQKNP